MENFIYQNATKLIFGKDTETQTGEETKQIGQKVLLHYGGGSIKKSGLYDRVIKSLKDAGVEYVELGGVKPNPLISLVREGVELCRSEKVDGILAVGGGSVIDSAKAIAAAVYYDGDAWDFFTGKAVYEQSLPIGVILTIPAAGSETSGGTVVTNQDGEYKKAFGHGGLRPKFAIMNPELTYTLPDYQTACGITDMTSHIFERYFTNSTHVEVTDRLCEGTLRTIMNQAPKVLNESDNYDARAEIMYAGTIAHNDSLGVGRVGCWATHGIEHEISGIYDIAHGAGLAIMFPAWMKYVYKHDVKRFAQFANRVFDVEIDLDDLEKTALQGIAKLEAFFVSIGMPTRLSEVDIDDRHFEEMARKATENGPIGNFVQLEQDDVFRIYELAR